MDPRTWDWASCRLTGDEGPEWTAKPIDLAGNLDWCVVDDWLDHLIDGLLSGDAYEPHSMSPHYAVTMNWRQEVLKVLLTRGIEEVGIPGCTGRVWSQWPACGENFAHIRPRIGSGSSQTDFDGSMIKGIGWVLGWGVPPGHWIEGGNQKWDLRWCWALGRMLSIHARWTEDLDLRPYPPGDRKTWRRNCIGPLRFRRLWVVWVKGSDDRLSKNDQWW